MALARQTSNTATRACALRSYGFLVFSTDVQCTNHMTFFLPCVIVCVCSIVEQWSELKVVPIPVSSPCCWRPHRIQRCVASPKIIRVLFQNVCAVRWMWCGKYCAIQRRGTAQHLLRGVSFSCRTAAQMGMLRFASPLTRPWLIYICGQGHCYNLINQTLFDYF